MAKGTCQDVWIYSALQSKLLAWFIPGRKDHSANVAAMLAAPHDDFVFGHRPDLVYNLDNCRWWVAREHFRCLGFPVIPNRCCGGFVKQCVFRKQLYGPQIGRSNQAFECSGG